MSETETTAPEAQAGGVEQPQAGSEPKTYDEDYVKNLRAEAAKYRTEARTAKTELDQVRQSSMSEAEKAIAEAEARGRTAATADFGKRLAKSALETAAAKRNPDFDVAGLEYVDISRLLGDDGEPDAKAITAAVERLVPAPPGAPSFDGGARKTPPATGDMNSIIRKAAGHG